ncbi:MAG: NADH-quinone oxidoreductase subunit C [Verrucomicrobiae bacterium]|nr:NADH-quinone oxidoreductase subunit C [Verrucomicrobiae bacterium]
MSAETNTQQPQQQQPVLPEEIQRLKSRLQPLLGSEAVFEMNGKLPAFRVPSSLIKQTSQTLRDNGFDYLLFVTAVDYPQQNKFELVYMLGSYSNQDEIAIVTDVDRTNPEIETVCDIWSGANWHEREVFDMFGVKFKNHPYLRRILLDDTWDGYPLRKDYVDKVHDMIKRPY